MTNTALNRSSILLLTNRSGSLCEQGAVVVLDAANAGSFTTVSGSAGYTSTPIGVVFDAAGIANEEIGAITWSGYAPKVNLSSSASLGQTFNVSGSAGIATPHSSLTVGDFGQVLATGTTPDAYLWGMPKQASAAAVVEVIQTITLAAPGLITFTNIPQTYNHLKVSGRIRLATAATFTWVGVRFGTGGGALDTSSNYGFIFLQYGGGSLSGGNSNGVNQAQALGFYVDGASAHASAFTAVEITVPGYRDSVYKQLACNYFPAIGSIVSAGMGAGMGGGFWANTGSITSMSFAGWGNIDNLETGSYLTLYGVN